MPDLEQDADSQDMAEIFDETHTTEDGGDIAHPDMAPDVFDVTVADDDGDDEQPVDPDDFDPDRLDESERELMFEEDDGIDSDRETTRGRTDVVAGDDDSPADYQGGGRAPLNPGAD